MECIRLWGCNMVGSAVLQAEVRNLDFNDIDGTFESNGGTESVSHSQPQ